MGEKMKFSKSYLPSLPKIGLFGVLIILFSSLLLWSVLFEVDKTINTTGVVEPKGKVLAIQNRFDSKIKAVRVNAGEKVKKGDALFILDPEQDYEAVEEQRLNVQNLSIKLRRLKAQSSKKTFFETRDGDDAEIYLQELQQLKLEVGAFENEIFSLQNELKLIQNEQKATRVKIQTSESSANFLHEKLKVMQKLFEKKYEGRIALLDAEQQYGNALGELLVAREELEKLIAKEILVESQIDQKKLNFERDTTAFLLEISQSLQIAKLKFTTLKKRVEEFRVVAPSDGTISKVFFTNSGEVVSTGSTLAELIPVGRPLIFTSKVSPVDILEVSEGQLAKVVLSNMDVRDTPPLLARISSVEVNSRIEENGTRYFVTELDFEVNDRFDLITPGVDGTASILLGKRTVLGYVLEPIFSALQGSFSE
jgi:membrane fusion protein, adhesin transport system